MTGLQIEREESGKGGRYVARLDGTEAEMTWTAAESMDIIDHTRDPLDEWRPGVMSRMLVSALTGSEHLCVLEQFCDPGRGAPTHRHAVEEVLTVRSGQAEVWVADEVRQVRAGQSVIVPAGSAHGFRNIGDTVLKVYSLYGPPDHVHGTRHATKQDADADPNEQH